MTDLTPILKAAITLIAAIVSAFLIPWIRSRTTAQDREELLRWVDIAVAAAQQLFHQFDGATRLDHALTTKWCAAPWRLLCCGCTSR